MRRGGLLQPRLDHAGLDHRGAGGRIDLEDTGQVLERVDDDALADGVAGARRARPAGRHGDAGRPGAGEHLFELGRAAGTYDTGRHQAVDRPVGGVEPPGQGAGVVAVGDPGPLQTGGETARRGVVRGHRRGAFGGAGTGQHGRQTHGAILPHGAIGRSGAPMAGQPCGVGSDLLDASRRDVRHGQDGGEDPAQRLEVLRGGRVDQGAADRFHVARRGLDQQVVPGGGESGPHAAAVVRAGQPLDQLGLLHPTDGVGQAGAGLVHRLGELGHPHPALLGLRE
ncbi:hypothetical protein SDC9_121685 [bioreactor metagenome]|uniref:Uncharacterized protein n=1 Tax=bioreactor metagenome TaxID=1076179 RepID=A0A645CCL2_9ZZZZ